MKKNAAVAAGALALTTALSACGAASTGSGSGSNEENEAIRIALIPPSSGSLAQFGTDAVKGWRVAAEQVNADGGVDGRRVELIEKETDADPATTVRVAKEATSREGASFIGAVMTSPEHAALNAQLAGMDALSFNALGKDVALRGEQCVANGFSIVQSNTMDINALAANISELPGEKWAIQAVDYATGHSAAKLFTQAAEKAGKEVVLEQFAPLGTSDFGSYITKIKNSGADAVFAVEYGSDGVAFVKQANQFNLDARAQTVLGFNMVSEPLFPSLGQSIVGYYNNVGYDLDAENELNQQFVEAYQAKYGQPPYYVPADNYLAAQTLFAGIEEAGSADPAEVRKALEGLTFDSIAGEVTLRAGDHQLLRPSHLGKVVEADTQSGLAFDILSTSGADTTTPEPNPDCDL